MPRGTLGYKMPRERSIDVDTIFDFNMATLLMQERGEPGHCSN
jgi:CMP-N-acetylneuraminic acid synthetase